MLNRLFFALSFYEGGGWVLLALVGRVVPRGGADKLVERTGWGVRN